MSSATVLAVRPDGTPVSGIQSAASASLKAWSSANAKGSTLETRVFYSEEGTLAAVGVGKKEPGSEAEKADISRKIAAVGAATLKSQGVKEVKLDPVYSSHAAATGATLGTFNWSLKTKKDAMEKREALSFSSFDKLDVQLPSEKADGALIGLDFSTGLVFGQAQNLARTLTDLPANLCTPTLFCERIQKEFSGIPNIEIHVRDKAWAEEKGMRAFLSVAAGTDQPPKFLEIHYKGSKNTAFEPAVALVGKGITFDSGGISLKPGAGMKAMRADMGGAATVCSAAWAAAKLQVPIDMVICTPLTENMPSGKATKPGDIITAMNGKTIEVDNTDAEGRLVLSDALYYTSSVYKPKTIIDVATLTGAMMIALGEAYAGVFSTSDSLWGSLDAAGKAESDPFWRMPFSDAYMKQIDKTGADLCNTGGRLAGSCTAAIFLREFVDGLVCNAPEDSKQEEDTIRYAHIDIAGVTECTVNPESYNLKGITGRPTRALIEFVRRQAGAQV